MDRDDRNSRQDQKRELREEKRVIKRAGNKHARREARQLIEKAPEEAAAAGINYGRYRSAELNGIDRDSTRRRQAEEARS